MAYFSHYLALSSFTLIHWIFVSGSLASDIVVNAPAGSIQGKEIHDYNGDPVIAFRGIPYAKPPIGDLRFEKPQPLEKQGKLGTKGIRKFLYYENAIGKYFFLFHKFNLFLPTFDFYEALPIYYRIWPFTPVRHVLPFALLI